MQRRVPGSTPSRCAGSSTAGAAGARPDGTGRASSLPPVHFLGRSHGGPHLPTPALTPTPRSPACVCLPATCASTKWARAPTAACTKPSTKPLGGLWHSRKCGSTCATRRRCCSPSARCAPTAVRLPAAPPRRRQEQPHRRQWGLQPFIRSLTPPSLPSHTRRYSLFAA